MFRAVERVKGSQADNVFTLSHFLNIPVLLLVVILGV